MLLQERRRTHAGKLPSIRFPSKAQILGEKLPLAQSEPDILELLPNRVDQFVIDAASKGAVK